MKKFIYLLSLLAVVFIAVSCEVGLGSAIDVEVPNISISSPEPSAVIRDKFGIFGTWSDDGTIESVTASFKAISYGSGSVSDFTATVTTDSSDGESTGSKGSWSVVVDPFDSSNALLDGTYEVTFTIFDNGGHKSSVSRQFIIDNTAPLIVLQRPSTDGTVTLSGADSYGQSFTLEGQGADDNNIDHIDVKIYSDADRLNLVHTVTLNNVPPAIQLDVAKYGEEDYTKIYGSEEKEGAKQFYCAIEAYDSAQRYPTDGSNQSAADTRGNSTSSYYLYDQISSSILSSYKITDVYHMLSGVYTSTTSERSGEDIIDAVKTVLSNKKQSVGSFSLNPTNNPKFVVNGKDTLKASGLNLLSDDSYSITNNSDVIIEVSPGLDNSPLVNNSDLKVYVFECNADGSAKTGASKIYATEKSRSKSGSNYKLTVTVGNSCGMTVGKCYLFGVDGKDEAGNTILAANNGYGMYLAPSGNAPELSVSKPSGSRVYVKKDGTITVEGYAIVESGTPTVKIMDAKSEWKTLTFNESDAVVTNEKLKYNFSYTFSKDEVKGKADKKTGSSDAASTEFSLTVQAYQGDNKTSVYKTVMYDVDGPAISINDDAVSPAIEKYIGAYGADATGKRTDGLYYSNGVVSVSGSIEDEFTNVAEYTWSVNQNNAAVPGIGGTVAKSSKINFSFDSKSLGDKKEVTVVIKAVDLAGNETIKNLPFFLDQTTDKPTFEAQDGVSWKTGILNPNYIITHSADSDTLRTNILSGDLYSKLSDDDGVAKVVFTVKTIEKQDAQAGDTESTGRYTYPVTDSLASDPTYTNKEYVKSGTEASVSQKMPSKPGFYEITETLYDKNFDFVKGEDNSDNANYFTKATYIVKVQGSGPQVSLERDSKFVKTDDPNTKLKVKIKIDQGEAPYTIQRRITKSGGTYETIDVDSNVKDSVLDANNYYVNEFPITGIDFSTAVDVTFIVTDANGSTEKDLNYTIDNNPPETLSIDNPKTDTSAIVDLSLNGSDASIRGTAKDKSGESGMKYLRYAITSTSASEPDWTNTANYEQIEAGDGTWNINVSLANGTGTVVKPFSTLYEGSYKLWVKAVDAAGNVSATAVTRVFDVDQAAPAINNVTLSYNTETTTTPVALTAGTTKFFKSTDSTKNYVINGKVTETNGIETFKINGKTKTEDTNITLSDPDPNGVYTWTYTINYEANKEKPIKVDVTDKVGRTSSLTYNIYCDTTAPVLEMTNPDYNTDITGKNALSKTKETFRANVTDGDGSGKETFKYLFTQTKIGNNTDADIIASAKAGVVNWTAVTGSDIADTRNLVTTGSGSDKLQEGSWFFYVYAADKLGNESVLYKPFWIDLNDPELTFTEIATPTKGTYDNVANKNYLLLKGSAADGNGITSITVKVDGKVLASDGTLKTEGAGVTPKNIKTEFTGTGYKILIGSGQLLGEGSHEIIVTATDGAEKTTDKKQTILVDTIAPDGGSIDIVYPAQTATVLNTDEKWYKNSTYTVKVKNSTITEAGSGIDTVEALILKSGDSIPTGFTGSQTLRKTQPDDADKESGVAAYKWTGKTEIPEQGPNNVYLKVTDKAGNEYVSASLGLIYLDSLAPTTDSLKVYEAATAEEITADLAKAAANRTLVNVGSSESGKEYYVKEISGTKTVNGTAAIVVYVTANDDDSKTYYSGLNTIEYQYGSGKIGPDSGTNGQKITLANNSKVDVKTGYYKITIPANTAQTKYQNGSAKFIATDKLGNSCSAVTAFTFDLDTKAPEVSIDAVVDADSDNTETDVNGNFVLSGKATDESGIDSISIEYLVNSTKANPASWTGSTKDTITVASPWTYTIDTTALTNKSYLHIKVTAKDKAQNTTTSAVTTVYINQDTDRPIIDFSNLDLSTVATGIWLTGGKTISGVITDDDGSIASGTLTSGSPAGGFCYKDGNGSWTGVTISSGGSWKITLNDGAHDLQFYVKDSAGNEFTTSSAASITDTINLTQPKLKSENGGTTSWIAKTNESAKVAFKVDTKSPAISQVRYSNKAAASITDDDWKADQTELIFGGTYNKFSLKLTAQDDNGIKAVKATFNGTEKSATIVPLTGESSDAAKASSTAHEWIFSDISIPKNITVDGNSVLFNGNKEIAVKIWDYSNGDNEPGKEETLNITIDNTPPSISFSNYSDDDTVFATSAVNIRGSETGGNLDDWYYLITNSTLPQAKSAITRSLKVGTSAGSSFSITFDGALGRDSEKHDQTLFDYICDLEKTGSQTKAQYAEILKTDDTVRTLYMWIWGKDTAGNESDPISLRLNVIPNGDKPSVSYGYPKESGLSLGGIVRLTGSTTIQTASVDKVYLQIDPIPFTEIDAANLATFKGTKYYKYTVSEKDHYAADDGNRYKNTGTAEAPVYVQDNENGTLVQNGNGYFAAPTTFYELGFTSDWKDHLTSAASGKSKTLEACGYKVESTGKSDTGLTEAIKANGLTSSWNLTLNSYEELNDYDYVAVRAFAISSTSKLSDVGETWFKMDPNSPQIGSNPQLKLVQYETGYVGDADHITKSQAYTNDMWISGQWYLVGSVTDDSGIKRISYKEGAADVVDLVEITDADNNIGEINSTYSAYVSKGAEKATVTVSGVEKKIYNYNLCIPVGDTTPNAFGSLTYTITAYEATPQGLSTTQTITLKYDNKKPDFALTSSEVESKETAAEKLALELTSSAESPIQIVQSNKTYTMYGAFDEASGTNASGEAIAQAGFKRIAFYFTRDITTKVEEDNVTTKYLIDPMLTNDDSNHDGRANFITASGASTAFETYSAVSAGGDGLYWLKTVQAGITENSKITLTSDIPDYVRKGSLVKVDGVIYLISTVDYENKAVTVDGTLTNGTDIDVNFAVAQVIDHITRESGTTKEYNKTTPLGATAYDDGDQMIETVTSSGSTYTWSAGIDSSLILDGPVTMHFVAFDAAGNATEKSYTAVVKNNAPRLYGIKYGTDINGDGAIFGDEWINTYSQKYSVLTEGGSTPNDTSDDVYAYGYDQDTNHPVSELTVPKTLTVKGLTRVIPQIVGGNNGLGYTYTKDGEQQEITQYKDVGHDASGNPRTDKLGIVLTVKDLLGFTTKSQTIAFKVWDYTDGTTYNSASAVSKSNVATINLPVDIQVADVDKPVAYFKPFHWNSASDNSLYGNKTSYGHIELENDWKNSSGYSSTATSGTADGDPKISGKVTFDGVVTDNVIVQEIYIKVPGYNSNNAVKIAERDGSGTWISDHKLENSNAALGTDWAFQLVDDTYDNDGKNTVNFKFHFNTEKISTVAATDVSIVVSAKDRGKATAVADDLVETILSTTWGNVKNDDDIDWYTDAAATTTKAAGTTTDETTVYHKFSVESITLTKNTSSAASAVEECKWSDVKADNTTTYYTTNTSGTLSNAATSSTSDTATVYATRSKTYRVDVVPYVTGIETRLSSLKKANPSVFNRTAKGHYPVGASDVIKIHGFNISGGTVTVYSEADSTSYTAGTGSDSTLTSTAYTGDSTILVSVNAVKSGKLSVTKNFISSLNNVNRNNSSGSTGYGRKNGSYITDAEYVYNKETASAFYNRLPNGDNNNLLTDDVILDVWQFDSQAVRPVSGVIEQPVMKIDPVNDLIGFAFVNGPLYFSMGGSVNDVSVSSNYWMGSYDFFTSIGFTYDSLGYSYGVAAGGDINSTSADKFKLMSSRWGRSVLSNRGSYGNMNSYRLESIGQKDSSDVIVFNKQRIKSPSMVTTVNDQTTNLYLAYYDDINGEIRYKAGSTNQTDVGSTTTNKQYKISYFDTASNNYTYGHIDLDKNQNIFSNGDKITFCTQNGSNLDNNVIANIGYGTSKEYYVSSVRDSGDHTDYWFTLSKTFDDALAGKTIESEYGTVNKKFWNGTTKNNDKKTPSTDLYIKIEHRKAPETFGSFIDSDKSGDPGAYTKANVNIVADNNSTAKAGEYLSLGVKKGTTATNDIVVMVFYDPEDRKLKYAYNTTPLTTNENTATGTGWKGFVDVFADGTSYENAGEHCQLVVDNDGNVHIAAYDSVNSDLVYAFLDKTKISSNSLATNDFNTCVVDSNGIVGSLLTLDVAKDGGVWVPYIGYYSNSVVRPKMAYKLSTNVSDGADENESFTGSWECSIIPIPKTSTITLGSQNNNKMNIGLWKNSSGVIKASTTGTAVHEHSGSSYGATCYDTVYGNGTSNPVMGYAIKSGTNGYVETAQLK